MLPSQHFTFGTIFSLALLFLFPQIGWIGFFIIILSTVLIDVDHYVFYFYKKKDLNLKNAYKWFVYYLNKIKSLPKKQREEVTAGCIYFLHGIEVLTILFFLSLKYNFFIYIFAGFAFHLLLDMLEETVYRKRMDKFSMIHDIFRLKKLKLIEEVK